MAAHITITAPATTGSVTYPTVGFQGTVAIFRHAGVSTVSTTVTAGAHGGFGAANGTTQWAHSWGADDVVASSNAGQDFRTTACVLIPTGGSPTISGVASFTAFTSTGFTLNWTTASAATSGAIIHVLVLSASEAATTAVGTGIFPTTNGSSAGPTLPWQPDAAIFCGAWQTTGATTTSTHSRSSVGFVANTGGTITQGAANYFDVDASNTISCGVSISDAAALITSGTAANTTPITEVVTAFTATGWTWTTSNRLITGNKQYGYIALAGGAYQVVSETAATTNTTKSTTGLPFAPKALLHIATGQTATGSIIASLPDNTAQLMIGAIAATAQGTTTQFQFDGHADSQAKKVATNARSLKLGRYTTATTTAGNRETVGSKGEAALTLTSDGWDAAWTNTDGTAWLYHTLVIGEAAAAVAGNASAAQQTATVVQQAATARGHASITITSQTLGLAQVAAAANAAAAAAAAMQVVAVAPQTASGIVATDATATAAMKALTVAPQAAAATVSVAPSIAQQALTLAVQAAAATGGASRAISMQALLSAAQAAVGSGGATSAAGMQILLLSPPAQAAIGTAVAAATMKALVLAPQPATATAGGAGLATVAMQALLIMPQVVSVSAGISVPISMQAVLLAPSALTATGSAIAQTTMQAVLLVPYLLTATSAGAGLATIGMQALLITPQAVTVLAAGGDTYPPAHPIMLQRASVVGIRAYRGTAYGVIIPRSDTDTVTIGGEVEP